MSNQCQNSVSAHAAWSETREIRKPAFAGALFTCKPVGVAGLLGDWCLVFFHQLEIIRNATQRRSI
jgi:hypothetical protein